MKLGVVKRSTSEMINEAVERQKLWMSKMRERGQKLAKYLARHTVKTIQTLVAVTPIVNKIQDNEVSRQSYGKKWAYLLSVFLVLAITVGAVWVLFNLPGCERTDQPDEATVVTATDETQATATDETAVTEPVPVAQPARVDNPSEYIVEPGDCLWNIAGNIMGNPYKYTVLAEYNSITNPDLIIPGQKILIPVQ